MMDRTVARQRPQSEPAPHNVATCLDEHAPFWTAVTTSWLVTPWHRQTNMAPAPTARSDGVRSSADVGFVSSSRLVSGPSGTPVAGPPPLSF